LLAVIQPLWIFVVGPLRIDFGKTIPALRLYVPATTREPSKNNGEPVVLMGLAKENRTPRPEEVLL
jgi:hypothetical protein